MLSLIQKQECRHQRLGRIQVRRLLCRLPQLAKQLYLPRWCSSYQCNNRQVFVVFGEKNEIFVQCQFTLLYKFFLKGFCCFSIAEFKLLCYILFRTAAVHLVLDSNCLLLQSKMIIFLPACMKLLRYKNTFMIQFRVTQVLQSNTVRIGPHYSSQIILSTFLTLGIAVSHFPREIGEDNRHNGYCT